MKFKQKKSGGKNLSDKIAEALTVKSRPDIEEDIVFQTKPKTVSRADFSSSESDDEAAISDFRKRNVNLLSEISKKYEGQVVSRKDVESNSEDVSEVSESEGSDDNASADIIAKLKSLNGSKSAKSDSEGSSDDNHENITNNGAEHSDSEESSDDDSAESDDYSITQKHKKSDYDDDDDDDDDEEEDDKEGYDISQMEEPPKEEFEHVKKQNVSEEAKKGSAVRNQLLLWEGLLEMRIHLQRCLNTANQMPTLEAFQELKNHNKFSDESNQAKTNVTCVLDKLLTLQNVLLKKYPETKTLSSDKSQDSKKVESKPTESDEEIPSDSENEEIPSDTEEEDNAEQETTPANIAKPPTNTKKRKLDDYEKEIAKSHKVFKSFRDTTIQKWNEKTRLATAANIKSAPTNTILQQISYILSDREKLVKRTQLKRSEFDIIGYKKPVTEDEQNETELNTLKGRKDNDEYIPEIFDDSDFYHQLLRELIECKSADISDPVQLSRQWIALQQMRSKMKRKVDTKATKGRKIKYVVHNQLVNFMAPERCTTWTEDSANELYNSLFGKMFENNNTGVLNVDNGFKLMK